MSRLGLLGLLIWGLLVGGLASLDPDLIAFSLPLLAYLAIAALSTPTDPSLDSETRFSKPIASEGELLQVTARLRSTGAAIEELRFQDLYPRQMEPVEGQSGGLTHLAAGGSLEFDYRLLTARGLHHFGGIRCLGSDPFNLFRSEWLLPAERTFLVRPSYSNVRRVSIRPLRTGVIAGAYPARAGGPGVEFFGLRRYSAGDPRRWINWKASARNWRSLYVNLFEQERVIELGLIVDARIRSNVVSGGESVYPYSVGAAASLAELFLSQGNRVGLLIYGGHLDWTVPAYGRLQRERIMSALAKSSEGESRIFDQIHNLPTRLFQSKTQLILVSPVLRSDLDYLVRLRARRYPLLVISPDRDRLEARMLRGVPELPLAQRFARLEQQLITRRLANAGIPRVVWDLELPFEQLIEIRLSRPQAWMRSVGARA